MKKAIDETERRRAKQIAFNEANGITPRGVVRRIKDIIDGVYNAEEAAATRTSNRSAIACSTKWMKNRWRRN